LEKLYYLLIIIDQTSLQEQQTQKLGDLGLLITVFLSTRDWVHVCVQRTSGNLALYINGIKNSETYYTTAINKALNKIIIGNSNSAAVTLQQ
jgi:hypothetical protein